MSKNRFQAAWGYGLAALSVLGMVEGCGDEKTSINDSAGSGGNSGWTYLPPGNDTKATGGNATSAGTSSDGGKGGVSGAGGSGGSGSPPITFECVRKQPDQPLITSFDDFMADRWKSPGNLDGGVYVYPDTLKPAAGDFLRFAGQVDDYTGVGVWFSGCIDGSKFSGVRFSIAGDVGATGTVQFYAITNRDKEVVEKDSVGACLPADPQDPWQSCRPPVVTLPVTANATIHEVPWSAFKAGLPSATTDGSDVIALQWSFDWQDGMAPFNAQLTVDDLSFIVGDAAGGAGGARTDDGGAGGAAATTPGTGGQGGA